MQVEYKSTKSESVFKVTGEKDRAFLEVSGQASTKAKVTKEVERIRRQREDFETVAFIAREFSRTH